MPDKNDASATVSGPLRILQIVDSLDIGGAERHVVELSQALQRQGHVVMVGCSAGGPWREALQAAGVEVRIVAPGLVKRHTDHGYAEGLRRLLREQTFDLVHAHLYASAQTAARAVCGAALPLVITHHSEEAWQTEPQRRASILAAHQARRLIAVSRPIQNRLVRYFRLPADRVALVPNAVPSSTATVSQHTTAPGPRIGMAARLSAEKGVLDFLRAAALIARFEPACRFPIAGDGPIWPDAKDLTRRLGLSGHVEFLGALPDARPALAGFDLLVVPSSVEGSPLAVLEAQGAGIPVIAAAVGGIPDQIRHARDGLLVPPCDPEALALACKRLLTDTALRRRIGDAGRARVANAHNHQRTLDAVTSIYNELSAVSCQR